MMKIVEKGAIVLHTGNTYKKFEQNSDQNLSDKSHKNFTLMGLEIPAVFNDS